MLPSGFGGAKGRDSKRGSTSRITSGHGLRVGPFAQVGNCEPTLRQSCEKLSRAAFEKRVRIV